MYIKPVEAINDSIIEQEWDDVAIYRDHLIQSGQDVSLLDVTEPFILKAVSCKEIQTVLDCGCGTGHLTQIIANKLKKSVIGIDISGKSIDLAEKHYGNNDNLTFLKSSIVHFAKHDVSFDACIANMVLMDIAELKRNLAAVFNLLKPNGTFCFTITHPCFWPIYWEYFNEPWFNYESEIYIKAPFYVNGKRIGQTTHVHRPLSTYISLCKDVGFTIKEIQELYPLSSHLDLNYHYDYPRFIGFVCQK